MASTPNETSDDRVEMMDNMIIGNVTDQDDGRDKYIWSTMAGDLEDNDKNEIKDNSEIKDAAVEMIRGVRIKCNGQQEDGDEKYIAVELASNDLTFQLKPTDISTAMGLELVVHKVAHYNDLVSDPEYYMNRTGAYLNLPAQAEQPEFGFLSVFLEEMSVGPVDVFRRDKKPITPKQVEALAIFGRFHIDEEYRLLTRIVFGPEEEEQIVRERREFVKNKLTRAEFESFFEKLKKSRMNGDHSWADEISPYDG